jgi:uncharacterized membrane protein YbaN (DUF454 family)
MNGLRPLWIALGGLSVALGIAGIFLPLLPTTPFMLLAAFAFARSSPRLHGWLVAHPRFGPAIEDWRRHGAVSRRAKRYAVAAMAAALAIGWAGGFGVTVLAVQAAVLALVALFVLTRPDPP